MSEFGTGGWGLDLDVGLCVGDTIPPVVVYSAPSPLPTGSSVSVMVTDNLDLLNLYIVTAFFPTSGIYEIVWDGFAQGPRYLGPGNQIESVGVTGRKLTFLRSGGWPDTTVTFFTRAWDTDGNMGLGALTLSTGLVLLQESAAVAGLAEPARMFEASLVTGDMVRESGRFVRIGGIDSIAQDIRTALQLIAGEWFLDLTEGIPYFEDESNPAATAVLIKNPNIQALRELFRKALLARPGVLDVLQLDIQRDRNRSFALTASANTDLGELGPLVVTLG